MICEWEQTEDPSVITVAENDDSEEVRPKDSDTAIGSETSRNSAGVSRPTFADYVFDTDEYVTTEDEEDEGAGDKKRQKMQGGNNKKKSRTGRDG